jgi:hypothetical protein
METLTYTMIMQICYCAIKTKQAPVQKKSFARKIVLIRGMADNLEMVKICLVMRHLHCSYLPTANKREQRGGSFFLVKRDYCTQRCN